MILYNTMNECWIDTDDASFVVAMTPEAGEPSEEFSTKEDFWLWYNSPHA